MIRVLRLGVVVFACALVLGVHGDPPPDTGRPHKYIVFLKRGSSATTEPDLKKFGGKELGRHRNRRYVELPLQALEALRRHRDVDFLALLDDGTETSAPRYLAGIAEESALNDEATATPPVWDSGTYQYDGSGNITAIGADTFRYDHAQRLKTAVVGGTTITYTYDEFGNQTGRTIGTEIVGSAVTANNHLQYAQYDKAGNQLSQLGSAQAYHYDALNMLINRRDEGSEWRYLYTADDERIGTQVGGEVGQEWTWTIRDFSGKVLSTYTSFGSSEGLPHQLPWEWRENHHYRDGVIDSGIKREEVVRQFSQSRYYHVDHLGTPRLITNGAGLRIANHDYHPFGKEQTRFTQETADWLYTDVERVKFTGHERDFRQTMDSGGHEYLDYMHARYYNPMVGRFLSVDPGKDWDPAQPQSWNMYSYVRNNPINATDPDGRNVALAFRLLRVAGPPIARYAARMAFRAAGPVILEVSNGYVGQRTSNFAHPVVIPPGAMMDSATKPGSADGETAGKRMPKSVQEQAADEARDADGQTHCQYCGVATSEPGAEPVEGEIKGNTDHIIPASKGGNATGDNAQHTCETCNKSAGANPKPKKTGADKLRENEVKNQ
jgi:RHS repeat-associated protein